MPEMYAELTTFNTNKNNLVALEFSRIGQHLISLLILTWQ
jgi:hypothetical protein